MALIFHSVQTRTYNIVITNYLLDFLLPYELVLILPLSVKVLSRCSQKKLLIFIFLNWVTSSRVQMASVNKMSRYEGKWKEWRNAYRIWILYLLMTMSSLLVSAIPGELIFVQVKYSLSSKFSRAGAILFAWICNNGELRNKIIFCEFWLWRITPNQQFRKTWLSR